MTYLDNAATSGFKPECVIAAVSGTLKFLSANPGRGGHSLSIKCARLVQKTRANLLEFLNCKGGNIVFGHNCTHALNLAILGSLKTGGHIITTAYEHNSVLRPLHELERAGKVTLTILSSDISGAVNPKAIAKAVKKETYLVITNHISNVTGAETNVKEVGKLCKKHGLLYLVDAAQSAGHGDISMTESGIDMLALAPHKGLHAPQGIGVLAMCKDLQLKPVFAGGTGTDSVSLYQPPELPESLESGTLPTPAVAGLNAGLHWVKQNMTETRAKLSALSEYALSELKKMSGVTVYTAPKTYNGIVSFNIGELYSADIADILSSQYDIAVRGGLHCAPLIHKHLGTLEQGIVRASFGTDTTCPQVDFFLNAVKEITGSP